MIIEIQKVLSVLGAFSILFAYSEIIFHKLKVEPELTRKLVHIVTGIIALTFPFVFKGVWTVFGLCSVFVLLLGAVEHFGILGSVTGIKRKSYGSILFPISVMMCYAAYHFTGNILYYILPISILTISDPLAAICGQNFKSLSFSILGNHKSIAGTLAFLVSSLLVSALVFTILGIDVRLSTLLSIAAITCLSEIASNNGTDNFFIPFSAIVILSLLNF